MTMTNYVYICSAGETWDGIARVMYGDEKYAAEILTANPEESDKQVFVGGEILRMPYVELPVKSDSDYTVTPDKAPWKE